jgi:hypothetical protein|tara:strand:- start:90 stop:305 length:216 start_codon:yes stop_codon:yes gene_type:complete
MGPIELAFVYMAQIIKGKYKNQKLYEQLMWIATNCHKAQQKGDDGNSMKRYENKEIMKIINKWRKEYKFKF